MKEISVVKDNNSYRVYIDSTVDKFQSIMEKNKIKINDKIFLITDDIVYKLYKSYIDKLKKYIKFSVYYFKSGEFNKNFSTVQHIYDFLIKNSASKESTIIALGGGIVGDLVGFVAATYMKGIKFVNIPTTLMSQVDSCVGGEVGYDYKEVRNIIGSFYNPVFVYISTCFLKTLKEPEFKNGLSEIIKYGIIKDINLFEFLNSNYRYVLERENDKLLYIIKESLRNKGEIVAENYSNRNNRSILNFGHTISDAIEKTSGFNITHGEAVALGMLVEIKLSEKKLGLKNDLYCKVEKLLSNLGFPIKYKVDNYSSFLYAINHDKKNIDKMRFALLKQLGEYKIKVEVTSNEIYQSLKESICRGGKLI